MGKMQEAENSLTVGGLCGEGTVSEAYTHSLLGQICRASNRGAHAIEHYLRALELNPTLWSAYEGMCELGADVEPSRVFVEKKGGLVPPFGSGSAPSSTPAADGGADSWLVRRSDSESSSSSSSLLGMQTLAGALGAVVGGEMSPAGARSKPATRTLGSDSNKIPKLMMRGEGQRIDAGTPRRSPRLKSHSPGSVREARRDTEREEVSREGGGRSLVHVAAAEAWCRSMVQKFGAEAWCMWLALLQ